MPDRYEENDMAGETFSAFPFSLHQSSCSCMAGSRSRTVRSLEMKSGWRGRADQPVGIPLQQLATQIFHKR
jgi:hypothetical protein